MNIKAIWEEMQSICFDIRVEDNKGIICFGFCPFRWELRIYSGGEARFNVRGGMVRFGPFLAQASRDR